MKNNPCQSESLLSILTSAGGDSQSPLISVTEAAQRLGVSRSTVYRIDRKNGPFRFVADGRRIFIDLTSFEAHLTNTLRSEPEPPLQTDDVLIQCPQEGDEERTDLQAREAPTVTTQPVPSRQSAIPLPSHGQREGTIPKRDRAFVVFYSFLE
jgi:excisionase family DNA binding protein